MSRQKLLKKLKLKNKQLTNLELEKIIDIFVDSIVSALKRGQRVEIRGFGAFFIKKIKEKFGARNPKTGEIIYVPEKNKVRFKASKKIKNFINK